MDTISINIEVEGKEIPVEVEYYFMPGSPARLDGHPDGWEDSVPEEFEVTSIVTSDNHDISFLLKDEHINNSVEERVREKMQEEIDRDCP